MEEKILITTKGTAQKIKFKWNKKATIILICYITLLVFVESLPYFTHECGDGCKYGFIYCIKEQSFIEYIFPSLLIPLIIFCIFFGGILFLIIYINNNNKQELTVSDKRVWGCTFWGKRVDLPIDSISAVSLNKNRGGISISTSSGLVRFRNIPNCEHFHSEISNLISKRQETLTKQNIVEIKQEVPQSNADELKKFKELLDSGIITEDEFEAKKKQLLGL